MYLDCALENKMPPTLADWLTYLESLHPKTIALGLERVAQVKQRLDLQTDFPVIVVGGTNGKGSVCAMLESMLHAAGYRVGCYTSPHLLDYNERVRIAKQAVSDAELCAAFEGIEKARAGNSVRAAEESSRASLDARSRTTSDEAYHVGRRGTSEHATQQIDCTADYSAVSLTYFEFGTLAAMQCFIAHKVDVAILEVGLGGRLDAVNVFDNDCSVIASVDMDHMDYLGDTREAIAYEKAGIMRAGKVAIFGDLDMPVAITTEAQRLGAQLWQLGKQFSFTAGAQQWNFRGVSGTRSAMPYPALRGAFQLNNASAALAALDALKDKLPVSMEAVRRGLVEVTLAGRFQVVPGRPQLILDVAHNPHAARSLAQNLAAMPPCRKTYAVFAMLKDKDIAGVALALKDQVSEWLVAGINAPRGASANEVAQALIAADIEGAPRTFATVTEAMQHACNEASENDRIIVFGSFYTVVEAMHARGLRSA